MHMTGSSVQKVVDMGVVDRARIAVGGHSYGAFMTANLLAHAGVSVAAEHMAAGAVPAGWLSRINVWHASVAAACHWMMPSCHLPACWKASFHLKGQRTTTCRLRLIAWGQDCRCCAEATQSETTHARPAGCKTSWSHSSTVLSGPQRPGIPKCPTSHPMCSHTRPMFAFLASSCHTLGPFGLAPQDYWSFGRSQLDRLAVGLAQVAGMPLGLQLIYSALAPSCVLYRTCSHTGYLRLMSIPFP